MNKLIKSVFLIAVLLGGAIGLTSCSSTSTANNTTANKNAVVTNTTTTTTTSTSTNETAKTETASGDKVGVPECDEYIEKYEACVNSKVPEAQRAMFTDSFAKLRKSWKDSAATPQGKASLATGCKQALDTAKTSMASFSCKW